MLNWEEEVAPALAKAGLAPQPVAVEPQRPQPGSHRAGRTSRAEIRRLDPRAP